MNATRRLFSISTCLTLQGATVVMVIAAVAMAAIAQYAHIVAHSDSAAVLGLLSAGAFWLAALIAGNADLPTRLQPAATPLTLRPARVRKRLAVAALILSGITFLTSGENAFTHDNVIPWLVSVGAFLCAFWGPEKTWSEWRAVLLSAWERISHAGGVHIPLRALLLAGIVGLGVVFYFYNLDGIPGEMDSDHAEKVLDVNDVVHGARPIFFERNTGREPLEFYLIAALVEFGHQPLGHMALKLVTAAVGVLVIPGTFFLARELMDESVAFLAAGLVAISKWPWTISRMGLRFPFTPVFIAPMLYFLFRAVKYQRRNDFLMAGVFLGVGLYGYNAFRMAPVLAAAMLILWPLIGGKIERSQFREYIVNCALVFVLALAIFVPLLRYSLDHPENFWYRVLTRLSSTEKALPDNPVSTLAGNLATAGLMFNWTGDEAWPNSIPGDPALDYVSGGLFLLGVTFALYRLIRYRDRTYAFILIGLGLMLLPSALSLAFPNENPSNARAGGAIPLVFIVVALPLAWLARGLGQSRFRMRGVFLTLLLLGWIARVNYVRYFEDFNKSYLQSSWNSSDVARVIRDFADSVGDFDHAYILLHPHWIDTRNVAINMGQIGWDHTLPDADAAQAQVADGANKLYVLHPDDRANLTRLQELFPNGQLRVFHSRIPGHDFNLWYVPGAIAPNAALGSP